MKRLNLIAFGIALLSAPLMTQAVDTIDGPVNDDLFFPRGVLIKGVQEPANLDSTSGASSVLIEGVGTVTVADARVDDFPRMMVSGGTKITSSRTWDAETAHKTWWDGQFSAPSSGRLPRYDEIKFASGTKRGDDFIIVDAFQWGLTNETFSFSPSAAVILPVKVAPGVKLRVAYPKNNDMTEWEVTKNEYCYAQDGPSSRYRLCALEISKVNALALTKENFSSCPTDYIENGMIGSTPDCAITCKTNYELSDDGEACLPIEGEFIDEEYYEDEEHYEDEGYYDEEYYDESFEEEGSPVAESPDVRPGYVRYRGAREQLERVVDTEGLTGEDLKTARKINSGRLGRASRGGSGEAPIQQMDDSGTVRDTFLNYVAEMRNKFGDNTSGNVYPKHPVGQVVLNENVQEHMAEEEEAMRHSAPLLPSTGPELFAVLAVAGLGLMILSAVRRRD